LAQNKLDANLYGNIKNCHSSIATKYEQIEKSIQSVYSIWDWRVTNKTKEQATILIEYKNEYFIFGLHNAKKQFPNEDLRKIENIKHFCIVKTGAIPYLYIDTRGELKEYKGNSFYEFIVPHKKEKYNNLQPLLNYFNAILYTNIQHLESKSLTTLQLKIAHEGVHLFGQNEFINFSPEFNPKQDLQILNNTSIPDDKFSIDDSCESLYSVDEQLESREYLKFKEKCSPIFQEMVNNEICLDNKLIETIIENKNQNKTSRKIILNLLYQIKEQMAERADLYDDQNFLIELYWYLIEGVPQYLEQKISIEKDLDRITNHYGNYCEMGYKSVDVFYPLFTGAAIWHGLDYLSNNSSKWDHLALQTTYNVTSPESAKAWLDELQLILDEIKIAENE